MPNMDRMASGGIESSAAESPVAKERKGVPKCSPAESAPTKGRGLRRWRRIRREQQKQGSGGVGAGDKEDSAQQHKRRLPFPDDAPKVKHEAAPVEDEGSTASVESRFVPPPPAKLDPGLESAGFAIGADSDSGEDRSSRSSTSASAPRERNRPRSLHGKHLPRADRLRGQGAAGSTGTVNSPRSSVESDLRSSNASDSKARQSGVGLTGNGNGVPKGLSAFGDHSDDGQPCEEVGSTAAGGCYQENGGSVVGRSDRRSADSDDDAGDTSNEGSAGNGQDGGLHSEGEPSAESVSLLQTAQEALDNEIEKIAAVGKVPSDEFDTFDDEWSGSIHHEEPNQQGSEMIKHLECRLEEASALIKEKDSRILELGALARLQQEKTETESTNLLLSQSEVEVLYQEKIEAEIQCFVLTRAYQTLATLAVDQMVLYETQKSLTEDYKQLGLKLGHAENRAMMLEEKTEKLQVRCKELSMSSEVMQLQFKASRVSLFCFVQFILLCIAIGTYLMQLVPSPTEVVPT